MEDTKKGKRILCIPDAHSRPDMHNDRFTALGNFIVDKKPDIVVSIGDFADMGSLCSYDKGTKTAEGRRYVEDINACKDALHKTMTPVRQEIDRAVAGHRKRWNPEFHITLGNHENRIDRAANSSPELHGKLSIKDLGFEEWGWNVVPFLKPLVLENFLFMHYLPSGAMGKPTGGVNHARSLVLKAMMSTVVGHSHQRDMFEMSRADGKKLMGLVVGCYDQGSHEYADATQHNWWSGLVMLNEAQDGQAEPAFYSTDYVLRKFL